MNYKFYQHYCLNYFKLKWWWCCKGHCCNNNNNNNNSYFYESDSCYTNNSKLKLSTSRSTMPRITVVMVKYLSLILLAACVIQPVQGGNCWTTVTRPGRCMELLAESVSRESCCGAGAGVSAAWSEEDMDAGTLFFWRVLGGGVLCQPCRESCLGVECGPGKKCEVRGGRPRCVCDPDCRRGGSGTGGRHQQRGGGPVCGTDGKSYRNVCRLRKRACRRHNNLAVAYQGYCQTTCERIHCPDHKKCLLDQNLTPHCVRCSRRCPTMATTPVKTAGSKQQQKQKLVCGTDGSTYPSACHLRESACRKGKAIPLAYRGRCKLSASCSTVKCGERQTCLVDLLSGQPRCVTCGQRCASGMGGHGLGGPGMGGPICGTNNLTYSSWCHMLQDACETGYVIETRHPGNCHMQAVNGSSSSQHTLTDSAVSNAVSTSSGGNNARYS